MRWLLSLVMMTLLVPGAWADSPVVYFAADCSPYVSTQTCCWNGSTFVCGTGSGQTALCSLAAAGVVNALPRFTTTTGTLQASTLYQDPATGFIGLGVANPLFNLHSNGLWSQDSYGSSVGGTTMNQRRARGSFAAPEKMQANDIVGITQIYGYVRDAANATDAFVLIGQQRTAIEALDAEGRAGTRYDVTLSSGVSAAPVPKLRVTANGSLMIGNQISGTPTASLDVFGNTLRVRTAKTPATATEACDAGTIVWDTGFVYVCTATNVWKRAALATW